jgi:hypothetical protein
MKIHSDVLTFRDLRDAEVQVADVELIANDANSRKRAKAYEIRLVGHGARHTRDNYDHSAQVATWHDWGWFIAELFRVDPAAIIGQYASADHFHRATCQTFLAVTPSLAEQRTVKVNAPRNFDWKAKP